MNLVQHDHEDIAHVLLILVIFCVFAHFPWRTHEKQPRRSSSSSPPPEFSLRGPHA